VNAALVTFVVMLALLSIAAFAKALALAMRSPPPRSSRKRTTAEWDRCFYRQRGDCPCRYRCVYEGPEDVPPAPDVPQ